DAVRSRVPALRAALARDERAREVLCVERAQILERLADADQLHWQAELVRDRDRDAALGAPVELREGDARHADGVLEEARLLDGVLTRGRVDHEQRLVRCSFGARRDHAANLGELFHEIRLRVQPAGGVDDDDVAAVPARAVDRVVRDRRGIAAPLALYELRAGALRPDTELLLRRGTEGV